MMEDVLNTKNNKCSSKVTSYCRICHEAEYESCRKLEAPCSCDGTVKYAHRECIQRWCDLKGNITCEICLKCIVALLLPDVIDSHPRGLVKNYEPGYTAILKQPKKILVLDHVISIRENLEEGRREEEESNRDIIERVECSSSVDKAASYCKTVALIITGLLLLRHLLEGLTGAENYPFSPATVLVLRSCGVVIPMCVIIRTITAVQNSFRRHLNIHAALIRDNYNEQTVDEEEAI